MPEKPIKRIVPKVLKDTVARLGIRFTNGIVNPETKKNYSFSEKEKLFVLFYLTDANLVASHAAKMAGYDCSSDASFRSYASSLLRKPKIRLAIDRALASFAISREETIYRIGQHARGDIALLMNDSNEFDWEVVRENNASGIIKEIEITRYVTETKSEVVDEPVKVKPMFDFEVKQDELNDTGEVLETNLIKEVIKLKLHSSQVALKMLGDAHGVFKNVNTFENPDGEQMEGQVVIFLPDNGRDKDLKKPNLGKLPPSLRRK